MDDAQINLFFGRMELHLTITMSRCVAQCGDLVLRLGVTRGGSISGADLGRSSEYSIGGKTQNYWVSLRTGAEHTSVSTAVERGLVGREPSVNPSL